MKGIKDLSRAERLEIGILHARGYSRRAIATALGRGKSTIAYEITKNSVAGVYQPLKADAKVRVRKRLRRFQYAKIEATPALKAFIIAKLQSHWNPDEIAGYMEQHPRRCPGYVSKTAIYEWLRTARGERYCAHLYSGRKRVKKHRPKAKRSVIPHRIDISKRSKGANHRTRYGHLESDTIVGRWGTKGGLKVVSERKSRLIGAKKVRSMKPAEHAAVEVTLTSTLKARSITRDNGIENRDHARVGIPAFFCHPYASWQKGGVENANKMLRRYFPKGTDFSTVTQAAVDLAVHLINEKPRKILGYRSAREVAQRSGMMDSI